MLKAYVKPLLQKGQSAMRHVYIFHNCLYILLTINIVYAFISIPESFRDTQQIYGNDSILIFMKN